VGFELINAATYRNDLADPTAALEMLDRAERIVRESGGQSGPFLDWIVLRRARIYAELHREDESRAQFALIADRASPRMRFYKSAIELAFDDSDHARNALSMLVPLQAELRRSTTIANLLPQVVVGTAEAAALTGDFKLAADQANEARAIFVTKQAGIESAYIARCDVVLARVKLNDGDRAGAHALLETAAKHMEVSLGPTHPRTRQTHAFADSLRSAN
jgi:ATP/maltotriose-dependent transcriptional regulator MalT